MAGGTGLEKKAAGPPENGVHFNVRNALIRGLPGGEGTPGGAGRDGSRGALSREGRQTNRREVLPAGGEGGRQGCMQAQGRMGVPPLWLRDHATVHVLDSGTVKIFSIRGLCPPKFDEIQFWTLFGQNFAKKKLHLDAGKRK